MSYIPTPHETNSPPPPPPPCVSDCCDNERIAWQWKDTCCQTYSGEYEKANKSKGKSVLLVLVGSVLLVLVSPFDELRRPMDL